MNILNNDKLMNNWLTADNIQITKSNRLCNFRHFINNYNSVNCHILNL